MYIDPRDALVVASPCYESIAGLIIRSQCLLGAMRVETPLLKQRLRFLPVRPYLLNSMIYVSSGVDAGMHRSFQMLADGVDSSPRPVQHSFLYQGQRERGDHASKAPKGLSYLIDVSSPFDGSPSVRRDALDFPQQLVGYAPFFLYSPKI